MKKRKLLMLVGTICLVLILSAFAAPAPKPIVLKAVCLAPLSGETAYFLNIFAERVNQRSNGELTINLLGAGEVIPAMEQPEATSKGVVDISVTSASFYKASIPEGPIVNILGLSYKEERESGFVDFFEKLHNEKLNVHYMGRAVWHSGYFLWINKRVEKLADMNGLKIRSLVSQDAVVKAAGGVPVTITTAESYSAIERGVVDGIVANIGNIYSNKLYEVVKYRVGPPGIFAAGLVMLMNLDSWNRLPQHLQSLVTNIMIEFDTEIQEYWGGGEEKQMKEMLDAGMEIIELSPEENQQIYDISYQIAWENIKKTISPESYAKLTGFMKK